MSVGRHPHDRFADFRARLREFKYARDHFLFAYRRDPLAGFLIDRLRLDPGKAALIGGGMTVIVYAIGYLYSLMSGHPLAGISRTAFDIFYDIIVIPATWACYRWISTASTTLFLQLGRDSWNPGRDPGPGNFVSRAIDRVNSRGYWMLASIATVLLTANCILHVSGPGPGPGKGGSILYLILVKVPFLWIPAWYMVGIILIKVFVTVFLLRRILAAGLFSPKPRITISPRRIEQVRNFLLNFTYYLGTCGYALLILYIRGSRYGYFHHQGLIYTATLLYLFITLFCFFFPLHPVSRLAGRIRGKSGAERNRRPYSTVFRIFPSRVIRDLVLVGCMPAILLVILFIV